MVDTAPLLITNDQVKGFEAIKEIVFVVRFDVFDNLSLDTIYTVLLPSHVVKLRWITLLGVHHVHIQDHHVLFWYQIISNQIHASVGHILPIFNVTHVVFVEDAQLFIV